MRRSRFEQSLGCGCVLMFGAVVVAGAIGAALVFLVLTEAGVTP